MPKFIDEGITTAIANKLNIDFGKYKYGFWNFSQTGVMKLQAMVLKTVSPLSLIVMAQLVTLLILLPIKLVQIQP